MSKTVISIGILVVAAAAVVIGTRGFGVLRTQNTSVNTSNSADREGVAPPASNGSAAFGNNALDLSNRGLTSIPSYVFSETNLEELNVSHNHLTGAIQAEIRHLGNLRVLNASHNSMTGVPAEIGQLQNLRVLDLSYNQLTGLPQELGNLKNLTTLNLAGNQYSVQDLDYIRAKLPSTVRIIVR